MCFVHMQTFSSVRVEWHAAASHRRVSCRADAGAAPGRLDLSCWAVPFWLRTAQRRTDKLKTNV